MKLPVRKWKPIKGEKYWLPGAEQPNSWKGDAVDKAHLKHGLVFATQELAEKAAKAISSLRKALPKHEARDFPRFKWQRRTDAPDAFKDMPPVACAYWLNKHDEWRQDGGEMPLSAKELGALINRIIKLLVEYEEGYKL